MPEEDIETGDLKERLDQAIEEREHGPSWMQYLSISTAVLAVLAAVASLESGAYSNDALLAKNDGVLQQAKASDAWSHYQAKGVRATILATQAEALGESNPATTHFRQEAERYRSEQKEIQERASKLEEAVKEDNERAETLLERHHQFARAVTFSQISIALSAIAALVRRKWLWLTALGAGAVGIAFMARGFLGVM